MANKSDLAELMLESCYPMKTKEVSSLIDSIFVKLSKHLGDGGRAEIRGFGVFENRALNERVITNPITGEKIQVQARNKIVFKPGCRLHYKVLNKLLIDT